MEKNTHTTTALAIFFIATAAGAVSVLVAGLLIAVPAIQEVQAQGPPAKAQAILAAEPRERGTVASGGQAGGGGPCFQCE